jgi:uncharacterized protein (TIGR03663 family)
MTETEHSWLDRPFSKIFPALSLETGLFGLILVLAGLSRLIDLGVRALSHDESLHAYFSYLYSIGQGYQYNPVTHGPLQFHLLALTYLLFGATDFTARLPAAIASILTIALLWKWRRYLGRAGTLISALLMLISPFMLFYGRYTRNEALIGLSWVVMLYAILRYLETGKNRYLLLLTAATVMHFTTEETSFIYVAQAMLFLGFLFLMQISRVPWKKPHLYNSFILLLSGGILLVGAELGLAIFGHAQAPVSSATIPPHAAAGGFSASSVLILAAAFVLLSALVVLLVGCGWNRIRRERSFDMLVLLGTFVLPQLAPLFATALGWNALSYSFTWPGWNLAAIFSQESAKTLVVVLILFMVSIAVGLSWDHKRWIANAVLFWGVFAFFYTDVFTYPAGFPSGLVGALGYWLSQQAVARGSQPWYYYLLTQIPIYEFLPALGVCLAVYFGLRRRSPRAILPQEEAAENESAGITQPPVFALLLWWAVSSLIAFTIAGEKMPWLTYHITLPMILLSGWALGQIAERLNWSQFRERKGFLATLVLTGLAISLAGLLVSLVGQTPPFLGKTSADLSATKIFLFWLVAGLGCTWGALVLLKNWVARDAVRLACLVVFGLLAVLTARTAFRAAYINYDQATEYLVYAHGASGVTDVMSQIHMISYATTDGPNIQLAYDTNGTSQGVAWPMTWYFRNYPNKTAFTTIDGSLNNYPLLLVDQADIASVKSAVGSNYYELDYSRMVWPNQDYFNLTWSRILGTLRNPAMRAALFQIWLNRDYTLYAQTTGESGFTQQDWVFTAKMALFIRKDIAAEVWQYAIPQQTTPQQDPYTQGTITLTADLVTGSQGTQPGQLNDPHGLAVAPDGTIYVADTNNNRIEHFSADGQLLSSWSQFSTSQSNTTPLTLNNPWDVAVSPDGQSIYVADTWNHRILKLTTNGALVKEWGTPEYGNADPFGLWGPRGIVVDSQGRVFVVDTGNKRIVVYGPDGNYLGQFGSDGVAVGQFSEPVGIAVDASDNIYIADTWNQRIQSFAVSTNPQNGSLTFTSLASWDVSAWYGTSLENKPYIAVDGNGHVFVTDPEASRVLEFTTSGAFVQAWGQAGSGDSQFGRAGGIALDSQGRVWVTDSGNSRLMRFTLP